MTLLVTRGVNNRLAPVPLAKHYAAPTAPLARKYTPGDIALLVEMVHTNEDVCGPAIAHLLIPQNYTQPINTFYQEVFNPWLNLHRPCLFATEVTSSKGKIVKRYRHKNVKTPLAFLVLLSKHKLVRFKADITLQALQAQASSQTDLDAAQAMQNAKVDLFAQFNRPKSKPVRQA